MHFICEQEFVEGTSSCEMAPSDLDEAFHILYEYKKAQEESKRQQRKELQQKDESVEEQKRDEEKIRMHKGEQVLHEGSYVCTECGLVMVSDFQPEAKWRDRCVIAHAYTATDRLQAIDKHLLEFMEKADVRAPLQPIQERLRFMKKESGYKSLNYAIALTCILEDDSESQEKLRPFLPKSNVSWARSRRLLKPLPHHFLRVWIRRLKENLKQLTKAQQRKFRENVALLLQQPELSALFHNIISFHGYSMWARECQNVPWGASGFFRKTSFIKKSFCLRTKVARGESSAWQDSFVLYAVLASMMEVASVSSAGIPSAEVSCAASSTRNPRRLSIPSRVIIGLNE